MLVVSISDQLSVFGALSGDLMAPALVDIAGQNRFLSDSLELRNENERINIKAGIDFQLMPNLLITPFIQTSSNRKQIFVFRGLFQL